VQLRLPEAQVATMRADTRRHRVEHLRDDLAKMPCDVRSAQT
jgi:hypothetical protein